MKKTITISMAALSLAFIAMETANAQIGSSVTINKATIATATTPGNQSACAGTVVNALTFAGVADSFYISGGAALGLADQGVTVAEIPTFTAIAGTDATISIAPYNGDCAGTPVTYILSVIAAPVVNTIPDFAVCSGEDIGMAFTGTTDATFAWANDNTITGVGAAGTGDIAATATEAGASVITVIPSLGSCMGTATVVTTVTVNALPSDGSLAAVDADICSADQAMITFSSTENITSISYSVNGGIAQTQAIATPASETFNVSSAEGANEYELVSMTNGNGCTAQ